MSKSVSNDRPCSSDWPTTRQLEFLEFLRRSGSTNMLGGVPHLRRVFPKLTKAAARYILVWWMEHYVEDGVYQEEGVL